MKSMVINFIKDRMLYIAGYIIGTNTIILYGYLEGGMKDWIYPSAINIFVLFFVLIVDFIKYFRFNNNIKKVVNGEYYDLQPTTKEHQNISNIIQELMEEQSRDISKINLEASDKQHFLSQWIHNMKTPVSVIGLILQKIKLEEEFNEEVTTKVEEILEDEERSESESEVQETSTIQEILESEDTLELEETLELEDTLVLEETLEEKEIDKKHLKYNNNYLEKAFKDIEEENNKLNNGLDQILNIIRMEEFFRDYEPGVVDLVALIKEIINSRKNQFIYSNVFPKLDFNFENALVITDSKWNRFMLEQIISNAIKYSGATKNKKYVRFSIVKTNETTKLTVKDEGVGIPEQDLPRVFEPFFTGENGRRFRNSTGIGLYITTKIAEKLGHDICIESKVDVGTSVTISYVTKL
jgi:signal transduction histidine kinase